MYSLFSKVTTIYAKRVRALHIPLFFDLSLYSVLLILLRNGIFRPSPLVLRPSSELCPLSSVFCPLASVCDVYQSEALIDARTVDVFARQITVVVVFSPLL